MNNDSFSFLVCSHNTGIQQVYINGLEIGQIKDGKFIEHELFEQRNILLNSFKLAEFITNIAKAIEIKNPNNFENCKLYR